MWCSNCSLPNPFIFFIRYTQSVVCNEMPPSNSLGTIGNEMNRPRARTTRGGRDHIGRKFRKKKTVLVTPCVRKFGHCGDGDRNLGCRE